MEIDDTLCEMTLELDVVDTVNRCNISELEKLGESLDPQRPDSCDKFGEHVAGVQAALVHTYRIVSYVAVRTDDPKLAAQHWKQMGEFCDLALNALKTLKEKFPYCGTFAVYDLALDYKLAADERYNQNIRDSECLNLAIPPGLFPKKN